MGGRGSARAAQARTAAGGRRLAWAPSRSARHHPPLQWPQQRRL